MKAPLPPNEVPRLATLHALDLIGSPPIRELDDLVKLASQLCATPFAAVTLIDEARQWFKAAVGVTFESTSRDISFCAHALLESEQPTIVPDLRRDARFADNPLVTAEPHARFYAGFPLTTREGFTLGSLCVVDRVPRELSVAQHSGLATLARQIVHVIESRRLLGELAHAREAALEAARVRSQFLANLSHELRTPLNTINGLAATLTEQELPLAHHQSAALILQCGESLLHNIQTILTHSSLEAGKLVLDAKPFSPADAAVHALRIAGEAAHRGGIEIDHYLDPAMPALVVGDAFRVQQILVNLLANAVKFTPAGRVLLRVRAHRTAADRCELRFAVGDTGIGITSKDLGRLFTPYAQADAPETYRREGTGLGLSIVKTLVELMGGRIAVGSRPGLGSIFRFTLTFPVVRGVPTLAATTAHPDFAGKRLLIVEPRSLRRRELAELTSAWGMHPFVTAEPVDEALAAASADFDFAIVQGPQGGLTIPTVALVSNPEPAAVRPRTIALRDMSSVAELARTVRRVLAGTYTAGSVAPFPDGKEKLGDRIPLRVLAADDVATNRNMLKFMCRHLGYQPDFACNGVEVLQMLEAQPYDLVLLDVQMPELDGLSAAREIVRRWPTAETRPYLVAVTANVLPGDRERCLAAGMDDYLPKPLVPQQLADCITRHFGRDAFPTARVAPAPAAVSLPASRWIDREHLRKTFAGLDRATVRDLLDGLYTAVKNDYDALRPKLAAACEARSTEQTRELVHGLKGGVSTVGWAHMAARCADVLAALRENRFHGWTSLGRELDELFRLSSVAWQEMRSHADDLSRDPALASA